MRNTWEAQEGDCTNLSSQCLWGAFVGLCVLPQRRHCNSDGGDELGHIGPDPASGLVLDLRQTLTSAGLSMPNLQ